MDKFARGRWNEPLEQGSGRYLTCPFATSQLLECVMSAFRGIGHSRSGRSFPYAGEIHRKGCGFAWSADVFDRPGRPPMKIEGHLDGNSVATANLQAAVSECLQAEISKRRL